MFKKRILIITLLMLVFLTSSQVYAVPSLYEYYNTGDDAFRTPLGNTWYAQTFTVGATAHTITSVKLKMFRYNNPGTLTVSIRATSGAHPIGNDLTSGTINANTFTTTSPGQFYEITLTQYTLVANTKYAIVCRVSGGAGNELNWRMKIAGGFTGGNTEYSDNAGVNWQSDAGGGYDNLFEVYGNPSSFSITIDSSPQGSGYVLVDGGAITTPHIYAWESGVTHSISANSPANLINGQIQYVYTIWSDGGAQSHNYTVSGDATVTASYQLQYYLTVNGGYSPTGQGWKNNGVNATSSNPWIWSASSYNRTALINWSLDSSNQNPTRQNTGTYTTPNILMSTYHILNYTSTIQYPLSLSSSISDMIYNQTGSQLSDNWYDVNTNSTLSATTPYTLGDITFTFKHWFWSLGGLTQTNSTDNPFIITVSNYTSVIAYWSYPTSPSDNVGFLIILIVGVLAGILLMSRK